MTASAALTLALAAGCGQAAQVNQTTQTETATETHPADEASRTDQAGNQSSAPASTPPTESAAPSASTTPTEPPASTEPRATSESGTPSETRANSLEDAESGTPGDSADTFTTSPTQGGAAQGGGDLLPVEVRTGTHGDITRVVVEFTGETSPGWSAAYVQEALEQGRGEPIDVDGDAILSVSMRGLMMPESEAGVRAMLSGAVTPKDLKVADLHLDPVFEGQAVAHIGLDREYPYVVTTLADPQRVVIDIRTGP